MSAFFPIPPDDPKRRRMFYLRRLQALAVLDTYHRAGRWNAEDQRDALRVVSAAFGDTVRAWVWKLLQAADGQTPGNAEWPAHRALLSNFCVNVLRDLDAAAADPPATPPPPPKVSLKRRCNLVADCVLDRDHWGTFCKRGCRRCDNTPTHLPATCPKGPYNPLEKP